jgi:chemotaxis protein CheX
MSPADLDNLVIDGIRQSCIEVFSTMLGVELPEALTSKESGTPDIADGVVSLIGLAGGWMGTGSISCSPGLACRISALLLMAEFPAVNEEVLDAVAELTNMIIGGVKNLLEPALGPLGLSIPTVVFGKNFRTRSAGTTEWTVLRFAWEGESLMVRLFLAPSEKVVHPHPHAMAQRYAVEV